MDLDDPRLHENTSMPPAHLKHAGAPIVQAHAAFNYTLATLQDREALTGAGSLLLQDPRDLANRVRMIADMASVEDQPSPATWATIGALALAGWVGADRSETLRVDTGDAA